MAWLCRNAWGCRTPWVHSVHMFVMGIDPGLSTTGYGIVDSAGAWPRLVSCGVIRTQPEAKIEERLVELFEDLRGILEEHRPVELGIEEVYTNRNLDTAIAVGRAAGVTLLAAGLFGIPTYEYSPSQVKLAVTGYGRATKKQVRYMVTKRLGLDGISGPADGADALAIALCHLQRPRVGLGGGG